MSDEIILLIGLVLILLAGTYYEYKNEEKRIHRNHSSEPK